LDFLNALVLRNDFRARLERQRRNDYSPNRPCVPYAESESSDLFLWYAPLCASATFNDDETLIVFPDSLGVDLPNRTAGSRDNLLTLNPTKGEVRRDLA
jgi:hypothetical protein